MSSAGITFSGLGSGLDTQAIISALLAVERRPVTALNQKKSSFKTQKSLFGDLDGKLETLRDLANSLRKSIGFLDYSAAVDREDFLTATANENAAKGTYDITVLNLATTQDESALGELGLSAETSPLDVMATSPSSLSIRQAADPYHLTLLDAMLKSYLNQASAKCEDPMLAVPVIPIVDIFSQVAEILGKDGSYTCQDFAEDIYRLQVSGLDTTLTGAKVQLPISRGVPGKTLTVLDESGRQVRYFGIRFIQTEKPTAEILPDDSDGEFRSFESLESQLYEAELRDILGGLLEWPSLYGYAWYFNFVWFLIYFFSDFFILFF